MIIHLILNEIKLILKKGISDNNKDETFFRKLKSYKVKTGQIFIKNKRKLNYLQYLAHERLNIIYNTFTRIISVSERR